MPNEPLSAPPSDPWLAGYDAAVDEVLSMLEEFDIRRSSLTAPLMLQFKADVESMKARQTAEAA